MCLNIKLLKQLLKNNIKPDINQLEYQALLLDAIDYYEDNDTHDNLSIIRYILSKIYDDTKYKIINGHSYTSVIILNLFSFIVPSNNDNKKSSVYIYESSMPINYYNHKVQLVINILNIIFDIKMPLTSIIHEYCYNTFDPTIYDILIKNGLDIESGYQFLNERHICNNDRGIAMKSILDKNKGIINSKY